VRVRELAEDTTADEAANRVLLHGLPGIGAQSDQRAATTGRASEDPGAPDRGCRANSIAGDRARSIP
jgi:hypothetical protein